ncbi:LacI family DNA-binding transcriptional regulator [Mesorhizobium sp. M0571]|uniref:LacI family DNA-binding transcriptional regulator n=1 Tax=Mesorhizobium sp. M0571 TaxID=2956960 RepID=UPI0033389EE8
MSNPTFFDIASRAGVGTATVERVLNGRGGVRPETVEKVVAAARALDYQRRLPEAHRGILRIEVLLVRPETTFFARLSAAFERIAASLDKSIMVQRTFLPEDRPEAIAQRILEPGIRRSGLILAVPDHPSIGEALAQVESRGMPAVQIVTRIAGSRAEYIGIDNYAAGRMAAHLLSHMQRRGGTVVGICHSHIYQVHRDRIRGFSDYLGEHPRGDFLFAEVLFGGDEDTRSAMMLRETLQQRPDLVGLYNAGGANGALNDVLRRHARDRDIFFVGHELTEKSSQALRDGTMDVVFDQAPEAQARRSIDLVLSRLGIHDLPIENPPIRFITFTAENI